MGKWINRRSSQRPLKTVESRAWAETSSRTTGRERSAAEFGHLLDQAGFALEQIVPTPSPLSIVVGTIVA